ncbi:MAG: hypothetical protein NWE89_07905 [Candidatus Bathyarchaeota archaeon]|nr:hypothetical protein [Candidatus Bathyarchaeota archaeon]
MGDGKASKEKLIEAVKAHVKENQITQVVTASHQGKSALWLAEQLGKETQVISVTEFSYSDDTKKKMKKKKITPVENANLIIQDDVDKRTALLKHGSGVKAAMEAAAIATDKQLVEGQFIVVAGSGKSFDTAIVVDSEKKTKDPDPLKQMGVVEFIK